MSNDLVSVMVPTYNRAHCLPRALDSALRQTHEDVEILVVDDGSTDRTREIVCDLNRRDPRVKYAYQDNRGVSAARNCGLALARGAYIAFLDSDDVWEPWKLEIQVACMEHCPDIGMIWTDMQAVDPEGKVIHERYLRTMYSAYRWFTLQQLFSDVYDSKDWYTGSLPASVFGHYETAAECNVDTDLVQPGASFRLYTGDIYPAMIMGNLVHTSTVMVRRERAGQVQGFDVNFHNIGEDYDYHLRTCKAGLVGFIDVASTLYQVGTDDRLSRREHAAECALNFLTVITRELAQEKDRIKLPRKMIREVLSEAHAWAGYELLELGRGRKARCHLTRSLRRKPLQPRTIMLLLATSLFGDSLHSIRAVHRILKQKRRPT